MERTIERDLQALAERLRRSTVAIRLGRGAAGSGVIWSADGAIVTNAHVASRPRADVLLSDGRSFAARLERRDEHRDLALLRIDTDGLPVPETRDPAELRAGELLVAVGHPLGVPNAVSLGIAHAPVSRGGRRFVQADLRLAPGNSGGPLADAAGRVVGINSMVAGTLALAVPVDDVHHFTAGEHAEMPRLGVALARALLRDGRPGLAIIAVERGSRAERAGLRVGDVLVANDPAYLRLADALEVLRGGAPMVVSIPPPPGGARAA
jgi:serine protease Do